MNIRRRLTYGVLEYLVLGYVTYRIKKFFAPRKV